MDLEFGGGGINSLAYKTPTSAFTGFSFPFLKNRSDQELKKTILLSSML